MLDTHFQVCFKKVRLKHFMEVSMKKIAGFVWEFIDHIIILLAIAFIVWLIYFGIQNETNHSRYYGLNSIQQEVQK